MSAEKPKYVERDADTPRDKTRGEVLSALAEGEVWIFITCDEERALAGEFDLKLEIGGLLDAESTKSLLQKLIGALP